MKQSNFNLYAIADALDHFRLMDDPYEYHDCEGVESIEDIAEGVMGMEKVQRSELFNKQVAVSDRYYQLLNEGRSESDPEVRKLSAELDKLEEFFGDNPAYVALLRAERRKIMGTQGSKQ